MEQIAALAAIALVGNKLIEMVKRAKARDWNGVITYILLWLIGIVVLTWCAHSELTRHTLIPSTKIELHLLDGPSLMLLALLVTSTGAFAYDTLKSFDITQSNAQPKLLPELRRRHHHDPPPHA